VPFRARFSYRVLWADCDSNRHMYYPNYFKMFDSSTHNLFEQAGAPVPELLVAYGLRGLFIVDAHAAYKAGCGWGDEIAVESHVSEWKRRTFKVSHALWNGDVLAAEGHEIRVWGMPDPDDPERSAAGEIPAEFRARFDGGDGR